jgi:type II secretory pathway component PulM
VNDWYQNLPERDRRILLIGAVAVLAILLLGVFLPLHRTVAQTSARVERKRADLKWIRTAVPELAAAGPAPLAPASAESLIVVLDRTVRESGLGASLTGGIQPSGNGALQLRLEKAPFDVVVAWLGRLAEQHAVRVESATLDAAGPGLVNAGLVLRAR